MRHLLACAVVLLAGTPALAAPPTVESVDTLLEVSKARALLDQAHAQIEQMAQRGLAQATAGRKLSDAQKRTVERAPARIAEVMRQELSWERLKPAYVAIYQETFDQAEVDALIAFYGSPAGRSVIDKMPAVMQRSSAVMQLQLQSLTPKLKQAMDDLLREAQLSPKT